MESLKGLGQSSQFSSVNKQDQKSNRSDRQFPKILVFNVFVNLPSNSEEYQIENPKLQNMMQ